jgi:tetratricopeptide (TPR) repeat protein
MKITISFLLIWIHFVGVSFGQEIIVFDEDGNIDEVATEEINKKKASEPKEVTYFNLGLNYYRNDDLQLAISEFNKVIGIAPNHVESHFFRGMSKFQLDDLKSAQLDFEKALRIDPTHARSLRQIAVCKSYTIGIPEAMADIVRAIELDPKDGRSYWWRALMKFYLEDYYGAIADLNASQENYMNVYFVRVEDNESVSLEIVFDRYESLIYLNRAIARMRLDEVAQNKLALADLNKASEIDPRNADVYLYRGLVKLRPDSWMSPTYPKKEEACLDLSRAGELGHKEAYEKIREHCK